MSKKLLLGAVAVLFLLSGCSDKAPVVDASTQDADAKASGVTTSDGSTVKGDVDSVLASLIQRLEQNAQNIYFDFDQFDVKANQKNAIADNAKLFNLTEALSLSVKIEGNSDEWGTDEYNYALGLKRAKSVKDALVAQGVDEKRISIISNGESNPASLESTKEGWAKNRRAEFKILP